ncbi:MAG: CarD family transcriptional regulator [Pseudomonadota bacterium]|nr:CarD family transcriptional regulator [Pseudomonadota bacterium]
MAKTRKKPSAKTLAFAKGDYVIYPTHGVGKVTGIEKREVAGFKLQLFVILFASEKMTLRVPVEKASTSGLRKISSKDKMQSVMATLKGRARSKRTMWSRRAQEYDAKINSGDPVAVAEVVRDLYRATGQPEQSYSERQMYEAAFERLITEFSLVENLDVDTATEKIESVLAA